MKKIIKIMKLIMVSIMAFSQLGTSFKVLADTISENSNIKVNLSEVMDENNLYVDHLSLSYGNGNFDEVTDNDDGTFDDKNYDVVLTSSYTYLDGTVVTDNNTIVKTGKELNNDNIYDFTYGKFNFDGTFKLEFKILENGVVIYSEDLDSSIKNNSKGVYGTLFGEEEIAPIEDNIYNVNIPLNYTQKLGVRVGELSPEESYLVSVNGTSIGTYTGEELISAKFDGRTTDLTNVFGGEYTYTDTITLSNDLGVVYSYDYTANIKYDKNNDNELYDLTGLEFNNGYLFINAKNYDKNLDVMKVSDLLDKFIQSDISVIVKDSNGILVTDNDSELYNNYVVELKKGNTISYTVVVVGDANNDNIFDRNDLGLTIDGYLSGTNMPSMDVYTSNDDEEFGTITFDDVRVLNNALRENPITDYEDNNNLKLSIGNVPSNVFVGDSFEVNVIVNSDDASDYIDGINALVSVNDKLMLTDVKFNDTFSGNYKDGHIVGVGDTLYNDDIMLTLVFTATDIGIGSASISGEVSKVYDAYDFEDLGFDVQIIRNISSNNDLASLNSNVGTFDREFDRDVTSYTLTVPYDTESVILSGSTFDMYSTVSGLVLYELTSDETIATITVTAEDGSTKVYTVRIVKEAKPVVTTSNISYVYSSNNYLKTLEIADCDIDFDRLVNEYRIRVDSDVNSLDIKAIAEDNRASVEITGNENFKTGDNTVIIKVTAENGDVNEYKLIVNKKAPKKNAVTVTDDSSNTAEKVVIIVLIVLVVLGLLYLIFKKDDEDEVPVQKDDKSKNKK